MKVSRQINAPRLLIFGYLGIIMLGTILLILPISSKHISLIDAIFTATSSFCVTGLIVKDTAIDFTLFGKCVILTLIQIGGLGYMTLSTAFFSFLGRKVSFRDRVLFKESMNFFSYENLGRFAWRVFRITIFVELVGTIILYFDFLEKFDPLTAFGHAFFHSVSAFCNAGFSTFSENLALFSHSYITPLVVAFLIIIGGIGFFVISDLYTVLIKREKKLLTLHTKIVLRTTIVLILIGTAFIFLYEGSRSLAQYNLAQKIVHSFFQAVTPRTAGFNTVNIALFSPITIILIMVLMFIGASPGGTGGGIKTSTMTLLFGWIKDLVLGRYNQDITMLRRKIPMEQASRSFLIAALSAGLIFIAFVFILVIDDLAPLKVLFEVISAFGTVGLSLGSGLNPTCNFSFDLSAIGKLIIVAVMISGKVGTITIGSALLRPRPMAYSYPEESIVVG